MDRNTKQELLYEKMHKSLLQANKYDNKKPRGLMMGAEDNILEVTGLKMYFPLSNIFGQKTSFIKAVEDISFTIKKGETLGLIGGKGCGKTTTARCILQLYKPSGGKLIFKGMNLSELTAEGLKMMRRDMQVILDGSAQSLDPRMRVGSLIEEPMVVHKLGLDAEERRARVADLLSLVQLKPEMAEYYPGEFSAEQRMRIEIARAMVLKPEFIICDDPGASLDLSVRERIFDLLKWFRGWRKLTYLILSREIMITRNLCDRVMIMHSGKLVEISDTAELFNHPYHPYTTSLLSRGLSSDSNSAPKARIVSGNSRRANSFKGCVYYHTCNNVSAYCKEQEPELKDVGNGHMVRCHRVQP